MARSVIHAWLKDKAFAEHLNNIKREGLESARTAIQQNAIFAVQSLARIARYGKNEMARIAACKQLLEMSGFTKDTQEMWGWGIDFQSEHESDLDADYKNDLDKLIASSNHKHFFAQNNSPIETLNTLARRLPQQFGLYQMGTPAPTGIKTQS